MKDRTGQKKCPKCRCWRGFPECYRRKRGPEEFSSYCDRCRFGSAKRVSRHWKERGPAYRAGLYQKAKDLRLRLRQEVMRLLGGVCQCCGEHRFQLLTVEHLQGGGSAHRARGKETFLRDIIRDEDRLAKYACLCYNCNCARGFFGKCPHEEERAQETQEEGGR